MSSKHSTLVATSRSMLEDAVKARSNSDKTSWPSPRNRSAKCDLLILVLVVVLVVVVVGGG